MKFVGTLIFLNFLAFVNNASALTPLQNILLGDFSKNFSQEDIDPLSYIFTFSTAKVNLNSKEAIQFEKYKNYVFEGKDLQDTCERNVSQIKFGTVNERVTAERSLLSTLQYTGIDLSAISLASYAKYFEFSSSEYENLTDSLVNNYCSNNLSIISKKQLKVYMNSLYEKADLSVLPSYSTKLFPAKLTTFTDLNSARSKEFSLTVEIFKSFCSWGADVENLRLMLPFAKNPNIMSYVINQYTGNEYVYSDIQKKLVKRKTNKTNKVVCQGYVCRKASSKNLDKLYVQALGNKDLQFDLKSIYCKKFVKKQYDRNMRDKRLVKMMNKRTDLKDGLLTAQFQALLTGVPDLIVRMDNLKQQEELFDASVDRHWEKWSKSKLSRLKSTIFFEEPIKIKPLASQRTVIRENENMLIEFDVNLGEFDNALERTGKLRVEQKISVQNSFLLWLIKEKLYSDKLKDELDEYLIDRITIEIKLQVARLQKKYIIPPWKSKLEVIIAQEILNQVDQIRNKLNLQYAGQKTIDLHFYYSTYALKYLNYLHRVGENKKEFLRRLEFQKFKSKLEKNISFQN